MNDDKICERLLEITRRPQFSDSGINHISLAMELNVSLTIAKEQLQIAEDLGYLCSDIYVAGVYYFSNRFVDFVEDV